MQDTEIGLQTPATPRHPRCATYPVEIPQDLLAKPLRVVINYAVCYRFRMPIFRRLTSHPALDVHILTGSGIPGTKFSNADDLSGINARVMWTLRKQVNSTGRKVPLTFEPALIRWLFKYKPDVLLIQGGMLPNNLVTLLYAKLTGTPIVWWSLGHVAGRQFKGLSSLYRSCVRWVERRSTALAAYSSVGVEYFLQAGFPRERCFNLINVVDTELVQVQARQSRHLVSGIRDQHRLEDKTVLLFVGSMTETKGIYELIKAFSQLNDMHTDTCLLMVGDGPERKGAEELAKQLGISQHVIFTGAVYDDIAAYFQMGDLFVMPGTGGLAISEAMAHGLPVLAAVGDGCEVDLVDEGQNGYRIPPNDVAALATNIRMMIVDRERLRRMGEHSQQIIQDRCGIDRYINEMVGAILCAYEHRPRRRQ